ncbi:hypothetical protein [Nocardia fluminea]|uniref:hypothetical protein n=1 Tax=Nocardia fluminea TaxID=134984 RepID=UPI00343AA1FE
MRQFSKLAAGIAASAIVIIGTGVCLGSNGIATANAAAACEQKVHGSKSTDMTGWYALNYDKIVSPATAAAGDTVTYEIVVGATSLAQPLVWDLTDHPPTGFGAPIKSQVTHYKDGGGKVTEDVATTRHEGGYRVDNKPGWKVTAGRQLVWALSYKVPDSVKTGDQVRSGGIKVGGTNGVDIVLPGHSVCFTGGTADPGGNPGGGTGTGSADGALGSASDLIPGVLKNLLGS